jgi:hypothetical protein
MGERGRWVLGRGVGGVGRVKWPCRRAARAAGMSDKDLGGLQEGAVIG